MQTKSSPADNYITSTLGVDLMFTAYVDTACAKSVIGLENANDIVDYCKNNHWPYALVEEREPFRFGPGKRIWSEKALVLGVLWGQAVVVLRISIVENDVPCLISKFVLKQLGAVIDLESNHVVFKKITQQIEPLHDLESGHVAIELIKEGQQPLDVDPEAIEICRNGQEVTMGHSDLRKKLGHHQP